MNNKQILAILLQQLGNMTNIPTSEEQAIKEGKEYYLYLDYSSTYGGYNLVKILVDSGGHYDAFNNFTSAGGRVNAKTMIEKINSFIGGFYYAQSIKNN